jgi:hypothetical protein
LRRALAGPARARRKFRTGVPCSWLPMGLGPLHRKRLRRPVLTASGGGDPRPAADLPGHVDGETTGSTADEKALATRRAGSKSASRADGTASVGLHRRWRLRIAGKPSRLHRALDDGSTVPGRGAIAARPVAPAAAVCAPAPSPRPASARTAPRCLSAFSHAPGWIRTSDPRIRSPMLYPAELRGRDAACGTVCSFPLGFAKMRPSCQPGWTDPRVRCRPSALCAKVLRPR